MRPHPWGRALAFEDTLRTDTKYKECAVSTTARSFIPAAQSCERPRNAALASSMNEVRATCAAPRVLKRNLSLARRREARLLGRCAQAHWVG